MNGIYALHNYIYENVHAGKLAESARSACFCVHGENERRVKERD